jgi:hypothetical protein
MALLIAGSALLASYGASYGIALWKLKKTSALSYSTLHRALPFGHWLQIRQKAGFSFKNSSGGGGPLFEATLIWAFEAILVFGAAAFCLRDLSNIPYCEPCRHWTTGREAALPCASRHGVEELLQSGGVDAILNVPADRAPSGTRWLILAVHLCPACRVTGFLSLVWRQDKHPQDIRSSVRTVLANNIVLTKRQRELVLWRLIGRRDPPWT